MQIIVEITDEEKKGLEYVAFSIQAWVDNAIHNRARQAIDQIVNEHSDKQAKKIPLAEKLSIVRNANIKTAAQRQAEFEKNHA